MLGYDNWKLASPPYVPIPDDQDDDWDPDEAADAAYWNEVDRQAKENAR